MLKPQDALAKLLKDTNGRNVVKIMKQLDNEGRAIVIEGLSTTLSESKKAILLGQLNQNVAVADVKVRDWLVKSIATSYVHGMNYTVRLSDIKLPYNQVMTVEKLLFSGQNSPHLSAVNVLLSDAYTDFGNAMTSFTRSGERMLNDALKRQIRNNLATGRLEGEGIREIKNTVKEVFVNKGFIGLTDKSGREWTLDRYSEMLTRTHVIRANNEGAINRAKEFDVDIVEISTHNTDCPICAPYEGNLYSISGKDPKYDSFSGNEPPYHPNCKHSIMYRPDLGSDREEEK